MNPQAKRIEEGQRIQFDGSRGTVRYIGKLQGHGEKQWVGVEWDDTSRGKHSGTHDGTKYFSCAPGSGSFVKLDKVDNGGRKSFLEAVKKRYTEDALDTTFRESMVIVGGGLVSIQDCDDKRRRTVALSRLRIVDVSGMGVAFVKDAGLRQILPEVRELRLARSLFVGVQSLLEAFEAFPRLRVLDASGNILEVKPEEYKSMAIGKGCSRQSELEELILNRCALSWMTVQTVCERSNRLQTLRLHKCNLGRIDEELQLQSKLEALRVLDVDGNELEWEDVTQCLGKLENLKEVYLSSNKLEDVDLPEGELLTKVETLSLANNALGGWKVISWLQRLGALKHLRVRGNPISSAGERDEEGMELTWRMRVIGRIGGLEVLDGSTITRDERIFCEKRYMSIEVASVWLKDRRNVAREHPRAEELYRLYGMGSGMGRSGGMRDEMVKVRLTAGDKSRARRKFVVREMPRGARMSGVRAVGKRLLGMEQHCCVGIRKRGRGEDEIEWETDLWHTLAHWTSDDDTVAHTSSGQASSELCVVIGTPTVM